MTSQHNTGTHPFYIGMYIHIHTHIYVHIYTSQKECLCIFSPGSFWCFLKSMLVFDMPKGYICIGNRKEQFRSKSNILVYYGTTVKDMQRSCNCLVVSYDGTLNLVSQEYELCTLFVLIISTRVQIACCVTQGVESLTNL